MAAISFSAGIFRSECKLKVVLGESQTEANLLLYPYFSAGSLTEEGERLAVVFKTEQGT